MDSEAGIFSITFDISGTRMITTEADKTIKVYKEDNTAVCTFCKYIKCSAITKTKKLHIYINCLYYF